MKCCNNEVRELLTRDMCCEDHEDHIEFSVDQPKEGHILVYSEKLRAFVNVDPKTITFG